MIRDCIACVQRDPQRHREAGANFSERRVLCTLGLSPGVNFPGVRVLFLQCDDATIAKLKWRTSAEPRKHALATGDPT